MSTNRAAYSRAWRAKNPDRHRAHQRAYHHANPDKRRAYYLKCVYGLTPERYAEILAEQNFRCAICKSDDPGGRKNWDVDHRHDSGKIRGLLCHHCNVLLGNAHEDVSVLQAAVAYLERHK